MKRKFNPPAIEDFRDMNNYYIAHRYYIAYYNIHVFKISFNDHDALNALNDIMIKAENNFDNLEIEYFKQFKMKEIIDLKETFNYYSDNSNCVSYKGLIKLFRDLNMDHLSISEDYFMPYEDFVDFMNNKSFVKWKKQ